MFGIGLGGLGMGSALKTGGGGPFAVTNSILGSGGLDYALYDSSALDRMWRESTGQTPAVLASPVGLIVGREKQAAKTFAQVMAGQPNTTPNPDYVGAVAGSPGTFPNGWQEPGGGLVRLSIAIADGKFTVRYAGLATTTRSFVIAFAPGGVAGIPTTPRQAINLSTLIDRLVDTTTPTALRVQWYNAAGASLSISDIQIVNGAPTTGFVFAPSDAAFYNYGVRLGLTSGQTYDLTVRVSGISSKNVPAHYASQASAGARPVLQSDGLKFDGSDDNLLTDWFAQAGANCVIAQVSIPASVAVQRFVFGSQNLTPDRWFAGPNPTGQILAGMGAVSALVGTSDLRGTSAVFAISTDRITDRLFVNGAQENATASAGNVETTLAQRIGSFNNNGGGGSYYSGAIKRIAFGKIALTLAQFQQIQAEWLAAA